jgi:hypothetical protein
MEDLTQIDRGNKSISFFNEIEIRKSCSKISISFFNEVSLETQKLSSALVSFFNELEIRKSCSKMVSFFNELEIKNRFI